ncbi:ABC transporter permease [Antarcticimicrobium luteum]|uniref:ABC transporter permease n=1 Tax=Antarcticimicrobium luteum TaxID=2547397 RepID=A0A4R5VH30_9RHOB|nr:ABC transporter permease [Antarcticimicrobium luteum]TDK53351.1 ABC transporter permease [Antarcticimicrobium luteum]
MTATTKTQEPSAQRPAQSSWLPKIDPSVIGPGLALILMFIVYSIASPHFLTTQNITNVLVQSAPLLILATGQTFALLMGGLDLSQGSIISLVSVTAASVMMNYGIVPAAILGIGSGVAVGVVNGLLVGRAKIQPFIVTLGMLYMVAGLAMVVSGGSTIFGLPHPDVDIFFWFGGGRIGPVPVPLVIAVLLVAVAHFILVRTAMGRHVFAIGSNEQVAVMSGIDVGRVKIFIFVVSGVYAALAGFLLSGRVISGQPLLGAGDLLLQSIGAVIIGGTSIFGGRGGVLRTLLGVLVIGFMVNGLNLLAISTFTQQVIVGAIIILSAWVNSFRRRKNR